MRRARSAPDIDIERYMLDILKEVFVIIDNCVDIIICNRSHVTKVLKTSHLTNRSLNTTRDLEKLFGLKI